MDPPNPNGLPLASLLLLFAAFVGAGLWLYEPALQGEFVSDDLHYVRNNPYIHDLGLANLREFLNPWGTLTLVTENYAPVHLILHGLQWKVFGAEVLGYHVTNVVLHALASMLLVALFLRTGIPRAASIAAGAIFLVHPTNVEAVAWISQLKSSSALVLALGAILAHPKRPLLGTLLFALALLAKPLIAYALPVIVFFGWCQMQGGMPSRADSTDADPPSWRWGWVLAWVGVLAAFSLVELTAFQATAGQAAFKYEALDLRVRSTLAIVGRYLFMVASGQGLSTFHEPLPADSWLDPWWLFGLLAFVGLGLRAGFCVWRGKPEGVYLAWAVMAWIPISGLFLPLTFPLADRYLYFVTPGLLGAAALWLRDGAAWLAPRSGLDPSRLAAAGVALGVALCVVYASIAHDRTRVWRSAQSVIADSIKNYPQGTGAALSRGRRLAAAGQGDAAVDELEFAVGRGYMRLDLIVQDPSWSSLNDHRGYRAVVEGMAERLIERWDSGARPSQLELHVVALAHNVLGDVEGAIDALERALARGGPIDDKIRLELEELRRKRARRAAAESGR